MANPLKYIDNLKKSKKKCVRCRHTYIDILDLNRKFR